MDSLPSSIYRKSELLSKGVSESQFDNARNELIKYVNNHDNYRVEQYCVASGVTFDEGVSWEKMNKRRWFYNNCRFSKSNLREVGFTGSRFVDCCFVDVDISHSIFDLCVFENCTFEASTKIVCESASFHGSVFRNTSFSNYTFLASFFSEAKFLSNSIMSNLKLIDIVWESAIFSGMRFDHVELSGVNIEFTQFLDVEFIDTALPFASIPFAYGAISYLRNARHKVLIKTDGEIVENFIDQDSYLDLLPSLEVFYRKTNNFFPLANILLEGGKIGDSLLAIRYGILFSIAIDDLVLMRRLCLLACNPSFTRRQRSDLYNFITSSLQEESSEKRRDIDLALFNIRDMLVNDRFLPYATLEIKTSIEHTDYFEIALLLKHIDRIASSSMAEEVKYSIELRHNCPIEAFLTLFSLDIETICFIVSLICNVLTGAKVVYDFAHLRQGSIAVTDSLNEATQKQRDCERQQFIKDFGGEGVVDSVACNIYNVNGASVSFKGCLRNCTINVNGNSLLDKA